MQDDKQKWSVPTYFVGILATVLLTWVTWVSLEITSHSRELAKGARFTETDGARLDLRVKALEKKAIPPEWFETKVDKIALQVERNRDLIGDVLSDIKAMSVFNTQHPTQYPYRTQKE